MKFHSFLIITTGIFAKISLCMIQLNPGFIIEPKNQSVNIGSSVILPCQVVPMVGTVIWTKDDEAVSSERYVKDEERYTILGNDEEG